jgi:hypothetical protein
MHNFAEGMDASLVRLKAFQTMSLPGPNASVKSHHMLMHRCSMHCMTLADLIFVTHCNEKNPLLC